MKSNKNDAARRNLLSILPRKTLENMSMHERPWTLTKPQLLAQCLVHWDEGDVREAIELIFTRTVYEQKGRATITRPRRA
jgi:hypothetical protein